MAGTGGLRMTVTYRDATVDDAAALNRLFKAIFCDTFAHLYRAEDLDAFLASSDPADWERQLRDRNFAVRIAEAAGTPVGYVKLGPLKIPVDRASTGLLIDQFYIDKAHQGAGVAQTLMEWTLAEAQRRGADALYLTVFTENARARRFYERYGFEPVGRYDFMVGSQADEDIIMRKAL
jgi:ribosomal protein S18 acetylase RimI-like enzyme